MIHIMWRACVPSKVVSLHSHRASTCARAAMASSSTITRLAPAKTVIPEYLDVPSVAVPWITTCNVTSVDMDGTSRKMVNATTVSYGTINAIGVTRRNALIADLAGHYSHQVQIIVYSTCFEPSPGTMANPTITIFQGKHTQIHQFQL